MKKIIASTFAVAACLALVTACETTNPTTKEEKTAVPSVAKKAQKNGKKDPLARRFEKFDTDSNGKIDRQEFASMLKAQAAKKGKTVTEKSISRRFAKFDADNDGAISLDEFKAVQQKAKE